MKIEQLNAFSACSSITVRELGETLWNEESYERWVAEFIDRWDNQKIYPPYPIGSYQKVPRTLVKNRLLAREMSFLVVSVLGSQTTAVTFFRSIPGIIETAPSANSKNYTSPFLFVAPCSAVEEYVSTIREKYKDVKPLHDFRKDPANLK